MSHPTSLDEALDVVERLPAEEQAHLLEVLRRRLAARERERVIADVREARAELAQGQARPSTVDDLCGEIES